VQRIVAGLLLGLGFVSSAFAGGRGAPGFSTIKVNWSDPSAAVTVVPTMSTYATLLLAVLLALLVFRVFRKRSLLVRAIAPLAAVGVAASFVVVTEQPIAGIVAQSAIRISSCSGSETYTATPSEAPPCFVNTCGSPVTVSYTFIDGQEPSFSGPTGPISGPIPITAETCTFAYECVDDGRLVSEAATQDAIVPSDGESYAMAYCSEQYFRPG